MSDTDYVEVHCGRKFLAGVEYQSGVSAPLVAEFVVELDGLEGASEELDFTEPLPAGALLITAWLEGQPSSSDDSTTGATIDLGPAEDVGGWMSGATLTVGAQPSQGQPGDAWGLPPVLPLETTPKIAITPTGGGPDLAHLAGEVRVRVLYRRTRSVL